MTASPCALKGLILLFCFNKPEGFFVYAFARAYGYYFNTSVVSNSVDNPEGTNPKASQSRKFANQGLARKWLG